MQTPQNPLPGVPHIESPFFARFFGDERVDPETYRIACDLHQKGYAILEFPDAALAERAERIKAAITRRQGPDFAGPDWRELNAWRFDDDVRALAVNEEIRCLLSVLYGRPCFPFQTLNFPKGTEQPIHTDMVHFSSVPERFMCGVWVALEDIHPDAGPLIYYPGSHKWPAFANEHIGHLAHGVPTEQGVYELLWNELVAVHGAKPERLTAKRGTALIWSANLLHGGDRQNDPGLSRWSQVTHYFFDDCAYYTPMLSDPFYGSIHFRNPLDIVTGERRTSAYMGRSIAPAFVEATDPVTGVAFDPALYLEANADVAAAGVDPRSHYLMHGRRENRRLRLPRP